jgi:L-alanine-DL-glutamate epimerase-like enolase superfamily enzyme
VKVTDLRVVVHERRMTAELTAPVQRLGVLTIATDEGIEGHTFIGGPGPDIAGTLANVVKPMLIGQEALDIGRIWRQLGSRRFHPTVQAAVDVALWDIAGKAAGLPVHRLLGTVRERVPAYTSSWVHRDAQIYIDETIAYRELGFRGHKLHPLTQLRSFTGADVPIEADVDLCRQVREAVGPDMVLALDSAWAYSFPEAVQVGKAIEELGYAWYEDPLAADDIYGYVRLKQQLAIPIMATEVTPGGLTALAPWVVERATDFLRGDVVIKGGITGMMKIAHLAEAFHLNCEVHDAYNALNNLASLHVIMALQNCEWFEVLVVHSPGVHDLAHLSYGLAEPIPIADGYASVPDRPGLGIDVDWELFADGTVYS